jgi:predicted NUDIX family NTP pyrophosphohydrolase
MPKRFYSRRGEVSAGLLVWRHRASPEYLLAHPGGPYWAHKDDGAWTIPKGATMAGDDLLATARREFQEETGLTIEGDVTSLGMVKQTSGKVVHAFAIEGDLDLSACQSNHFEMEWPPRSGRRQTFPEIDRVAYFTYPQARTKIIAYQRPLIDDLHKKLGGA